jgi:hypothetical protein
VSRPALWRLFVQYFSGGFALLVSASTEMKSSQGCKSMADSELKQS